MVLKGLYLLILRITFHSGLREVLNFYRTGVFLFLLKIVLFKTQLLKISISVRISESLQDVIGVRLEHRITISGRLDLYLFIIFTFDIIGA